LNIFVKNADIGSLEIQIDDYDPGIWTHDVELKYNDNVIGILQIEFNFITTTNSTILPGVKALDLTLSKASLNFKKLRESNLNK